MRVLNKSIIVTGADLAQQALKLLTGYDIVYAGKTPTEDDMVALCRARNPVAIIVRYGKVGAAVMDAAPALKVISKHGSGTDTIDKVAAKARGIELVAAVGANAAAVAEQALAKRPLAVDGRVYAAAMVGYGRAESLAQLAGKGRIFNHDIGLTRQQQTQRVKIGRANRGPTSINDRDFGMQKT
eukprot:gene39561-52173_t